MDKLKAMQLFVRVAETGSFTAVADQLDVARSVVTRQISALEKQLGTKLMTRSTRSLTLTTAGSAYLENGGRGRVELARREDRAARTHSLGAAFEFWLATPHACPAAIW